MPMNALQRKDLETPALIVIESIFRTNLEMAMKTAQHPGMCLRPHVKTHKCPDIAKMQRQLGATGFTVATLGEAEALLDAGFDNIFIAYPIVGEGRLRHFAQLLGRGKMLATVDHPAQIPALAALAEKAGIRLDLRLEIDCGHHRCGLPPGPELVALGREVVSHDSLRLEGVFTHAGHSYGAKSAREIAEIGRIEGETVVAAARVLRDAGLQISTISAGSTPTLPSCSMVQGVNEVRPGNYVFNDGIQIALGVAAPEQCALRVLTTVISVFPDRFIIDAGSKAFGLDKGAHGLESAKGYGRIIGYESCELARLSEEHGIVVTTAFAGKRLPEVGDQLQIIPNHACAAVNLSGTLFPIDEKNGEVLGQWPVMGRR